MGVKGPHMRCENCGTEESEEWFDWNSGGDTGLITLCSTCYNQVCSDGVYTTQKVGRQAMSELDAEIRKLIVETLKAEAGQNLIKQVVGDAEALIDLHDEISDLEIKLEEVSQTVLDLPVIKELQAKIEELESVAKLGVSLIKAVRGVIVDEQQKLERDAQGSDKEVSDGENNSNNK